MISICFDGFDGFDEETGEFIKIPKCKLFLEHSLVAIRKWESKWHKPFLTEDEKTDDEWADYIRCMTLNRKDIHPSVYHNLRDEDILKISNYINDPSTATWFKEVGSSKGSPKKEVVTAELIYYYMISFNIPAEFEKWHINQLMTLIRVFKEKNEPNKKRTEAEIIAERAKLNKIRQAQLKGK